MSNATTKSRTIAALRYVFTQLFPAQPYVLAKDKIFGGIGAFLGILGLIWSAHYVTPQASLLVVASMGASAVLFFAAPHSPLAQPWAFAGGHLLSSVSGVTCYQFIQDPFIAAAAAVSTAIVLMHFLHCLHPPGGATALFAVTGGEAVHNLGYGYILVPVALNVGIFLTLAIVVNNLVVPRRRYPTPSSNSPPKPEAQPTSPGVIPNRSDIEEAVKEIGGFIDVTEGDMEDITASAIGHARLRILATRRVSDIMRRNVPSCDYDDHVNKAWELVRFHLDSGVPVLDSGTRVVGTVTLVDFIDHVARDQRGTSIDHVSSLIHSSSCTALDRPQVVGELMASPAITVRDDARLETLIPMFAEDRIHHLPVVDSSQRLVGMVTRADLFAALMVGPESEAAS